MSDEKQIAKKEEQEVAEPERMGTVYTPAVDISEDDATIRLLADMPGTDDKSVDINVENGVLRLEGEVRTDAPADYELVGKECDYGRYRREFTLSDRVDMEGIKARVKNGVVEVTIPKQDKVQKKKIEITS